MPVVSVSKMWSTFGSSIESSDNKTFTLTQEESYQVTITVDPPTTGDEIYGHPSIPKVGWRMPGTTLPIFVRSVKPKTISPILIQIDVSYSGQVVRGQISPLLERADIKRRALQSVEPVDQTWLGEPITTVNYEPINGASRQIYDMQYTITKNYAIVNDDLIIQYLNSTNSDNWFGYAPGRAKLVGYSAEEVLDRTNDFYTISYFRVTWDIIVRYPYNTTPDKAWYFRNRHEGFYRKTASGKIGRAVDEQGNDTSKPVLLAPDGTQLFGTANAYWQEWQIYNSLPYNALIGIIP